MLRQSQDLVSRVHSVTLVAACAAATISFCVGYWIKDALGLALLFIGAGYLAYERLTKQRSIRRDQLVDLPSVAINFPGRAKDDKTESIEGEVSKLGRLLLIERKVVIGLIET